MLEEKSRISWTLALITFMVPVLGWILSIGAFTKGYIDGQLDVPFVAISLMMLLVGGCSTYWFLMQEELDASILGRMAFLMLVTVFLGSLTDIVYHITSLKIESAWTLQHAAFGLSFYFVSLWVLQTFFVGGVAIRDRSKIGAFFTHIRLIDRSQLVF